MLFVGFSLKLLESYFQDILVQLGLPVPFAPGRKEVVLSLWFTSAKHLSCCSYKSLPLQFSWHASGLAERLSRSPAGSSGGVELTYLTGDPHWSVVRITCTLVASSSLTTRSAGAQNPHRGCANLGGIRTHWKGVRRVVVLNKRTAALVWGCVLPC